MGTGSLWIRESPRWLFAQERREEGISNLCWIRQLRPNDKYIIEEIALIGLDHEEQRSIIGAGFWAPLQVLSSSRKLQWRFLLGDLLFLFQNGSGINAVNYYIRVPTMN